MRRELFPILVVTLFGLMPPAALAQTNCQPFSALMQASVVVDPASSLPPDLAAHSNEFGWGGTVFGVVGTGGEYLGGWFYGKDDAESPIYAKANGRGKNGIYKFAFGTFDQGVFTITDTFDLQLGEAVWTVDAHSAVYTGNYKASGQMTNGTGIFAGAKGSFTLHGDFAFTAVNGVPVSVWNPKLVGTMCR